jgi:hypothetical protein
MNVDSENPNARQNKLFEIILKMFKVEKLIRSKEKLAEEEKPFEICLANNKSIKEYADAIDIIYEGASFSAQLDDIWFNGLLYSNESHLLKHIGTSYQTDKKIYQMKYEKEYKAEGNDMILQIGKHTSDALIKAQVYDKDGNETDKLVCDSRSFKQSTDAGSVKIPAGSSCKIQFPIRPAACIFSGYLRDRYQGNNRETNEFAKLDMQQGAIFKQVVAK